MVSNEQQFSLEAEKQTKKKEKNIQTGSNTTSGAPNSHRGSVHFSVQSLSIHSRNLRLRKCESGEFDIANFY